MADIIAPFIKQGWVRNYLDDVILWGDNFQILLERLQKIFECFIEKGIKLNLNKCAIGQRSVKFLGHIVSEKGCIPDVKNVKAVLDMKAPKNVKEVRRFLGMTGFYRKHVEEFAKIAVPLTELTKKEVKFNWSEKCQNAFEVLKSKLVEAPILMRANINKPFILTTDASDTSVGAVLNQVKEDGTVGVIGYFSRKLKPVEKRYSATDKEALGVVLACRNFHHYLWGTKFTINTDHQPLISVFHRKTKSPRMNRWILEMREYEYKMIYLKGKYNVVADQLSRPVRMITCETDERIFGLTKEEFRYEQLSIEKWEEMIGFLEGGRVPRAKYANNNLSQFSMNDGLLYFCPPSKEGNIIFTLVIPQGFKNQALDMAHNRVGHLGQRKTIHKAEELFFWEDLKKDTIKFVNECTLCQQVKGNKGMEQKWQQVPPATFPLERISMDLTDMVSGQDGYKYALTIIDNYSRYVKFYPLRNKVAKTITNAFGKFVSDFGAPFHIVTDNGQEFVGTVFRDYCARNGIKQHTVTPYHPQGNALIERMHGTMKTILATLVKGQPYKWPAALDTCQVTINNAVHGTIRAQPYFAFFNRYPRRNPGFDLPSVENESDDLAVAHQIIADTNRKLSQQYLDQKNKSRKNVCVEKDALVWVRKETAIAGTARKLNMRWCGPFKVKEVIRGGSAYVLTNMWTGAVIKRAAEKVKECLGQEEMFLENEQHSDGDEFEEEEERLRTRLRRPPRRLIDEIA